LIYCPRPISPNIILICVQVKLSSEEGLTSETEHQSPPIPPLNPSPQNGNLGSELFVKFGTCSGRLLVRPDSVAAGPPPCGVSVARAQRNANGICDDNSQRALLGADCGRLRDADSRTALQKAGSPGGRRGGWRGSRRSQWRRSFSPIAPHGYHMPGPSTGSQAIAKSSGDDGSYYLAHRVLPAMLLRRCGALTPEACGYIVQAHHSEQLVQHSDMPARFHALQRPPPGDSDCGSHFDTRTLVAKAQRALDGEERNLREARSFRAMQTTEPGPLPAMQSSDRILRFSLPLASAEFSWYRSRISRARRFILSRFCGMP